MLDVLARWSVGAGLVTWRYLWMTTPLHRKEEVGMGLSDLPGQFPAEMYDDSVQLAGSGVGPLYHRRFTVRIASAQSSPEELMQLVIGQFHEFVPKEVVGITREEEGQLCAGQEFIVRMPGPWDGPVRVLSTSPRSLRLGTLEGHLEAGQIQFATEQQGEDLVFTVETWARSATRLVSFLYAHLRVAKEIQLNMWVRFCLAAARHAGGRPRDGVEIVTWRVPEAALPVDPDAQGGPRLRDGVEPSGGVAGVGAS